MISPVTTPLSRPRTTIMQLRRRLQATSNSTLHAAITSLNTTSSTNTTATFTGSGSSATTSSLAADDTLSDEEQSAFTPDQLVTLHVSGWLALSLYAFLTLAILWMAIQHFRHDSTPRKRIFHLLLLTSVVFNLPDPLGWLLWPESESWVYTYPLRIYSLLLQSVCKSIISIAWSEVVSAGQSDERRRVSYLVMVFNGILCLWGVSVPILLSKYPNDVYGQYDFMLSPLRKVVTYSGVGVIFVYGLILAFQGMRLRRRLLQAKGTVPIGSVEKSLSQLMLTLYVIVFSDLMRIGSLMLNEMNVEMPIIIFLVCNNLIPNIFPTICMLYLMRRYSKKDRDAAAVAVQSSSDPANKTTATRRLPPRGAETTLSRYMAEDRDSDLASAPVLGMSKFTLNASEFASIDRVDLDGDDHYHHHHHHHNRHHRSGSRPEQMHSSHQELVDSRGSQHATLTPASHWVRE